MSLEFLEKTIQDIALKVFPDGIPMEPTSHVKCDNYQTCGKIVAVSLAQGGPPPPFFLQRCSYDAIYKSTEMRVSKCQPFSKEIGKRNLNPHV